MKIDKERLELIANGTTTKERQAGRTFYMCWQICQLLNKRKLVKGKTIPVFGYAQQLEDISEMIVDIAMFMKVCPKLILEKTTKIEITVYRRRNWIKSILFFLFKLYKNEKKLCRIRLMSSGALREICLRGYNLTPIFIDHHLRDYVDSELINQFNLIGIKIHPFP